MSKQSADARVNGQETRNLLANEIDSKKTADEIHRVKFKSKNADDDSQSDSSSSILENIYQTNEEKNDKSKHVEIKVYDEDGSHDSDLEDIYLNVPKPKLPYIPRKSTASRQSIEMFLGAFPKSENSYVDREIMNTVHEIIKSDMGFKKDMSLVDKIRLVLNSHKFHFILILLVVIDVCCVLIQVVIDILSKDFHNHILHIFEEIAEITSLCVLSFFLLVILASMVFIPKVFFKSKLEIFDAIIVALSFSLEIVSIVKKNNLRTLELGLIVFRFWRVVRIVMTVVINVEKQVFEKLEKLKEDIKIVVDENQTMESQIHQNELEISELRSKLARKTASLNETQRLLEIFLKSKSKQMNTIQEQDESGDKLNSNYDEALKRIQKIESRISKQT